MDTGFGTNLEGFLVKGNLSIAPSLLPNSQGDGSLEGSGTLYYNSIREYNKNNGVDIQRIILRDDQIYIPYTSPATNESTASFVLDGGAFIKCTTNAANISSGGALTIKGGTSIKKDLFVGGQVDVGLNFIKNVKHPVEDNDAATKKYVDDQRVSGNFTTGQVLIAESDGYDIRGYNNFTFDGIQLLLSSTANATGSVGGAFMCLGGISISKDAFIGGRLNVNNNKIINVAEPENNSDAATKYYVDNKTYGNLIGSFGNTQIITGSTNPNALTSYPAFTIDGENLQISQNGKLFISNTAATTSLTGESSLKTLGGASIYKDLYVGGKIDVSGNKIVNLAEPVNGSDAATKYYVDNNKLQGNFTTGQLIIAQTNGSAIRGYDNLSFSTSDGTIGSLTLDKNTKIFINNTSNATGLGIGGSFVNLGGATFVKNVYIGGQLDVGLNRITSVDDPIQDYDAVNKRYVQSLIDVSVVGDNSLLLNNNTALPEDISALTFDSSIRAFVLYIYVNNNNERSAVYTIRGINTGTQWYIVNTFVGEPSGVDFYIRRNPTDGKGIVQYTNLNISGYTSIFYRTFTQIFDSVIGSQKNITLANHVGTLLELPDLTYSNNEVDGAKLVVHVSNDSHTEDGLLFINILQKNGSWVLNSHSIGDISENISFSIVSNGTSGVIGYTNTNTSGSYRLKVQEFPIAAILSTYTLLANTTIPTSTTIQDFTFPKTHTNFNLTIYAEKPSINKHALYEITALSKNNIWKINSRLIGDPLGIKFSVLSTDDNYILQYTNTTAENVVIKYLLNTPPTFQPLPVTKGGTGKTYLTPYAVLRGNGTEAVLASSDFIYKDKVLILGNESSIRVNNSTSATGLGTGGALTIFGGAAISKNLIVGGEIDAQYNNIKNVKDPEVELDAANKGYVDKLVNGILANSNSFVLNNNVSIPQNVPSFTFPADTKAFVAYVYVEYKNTECAVFKLRGIKRQTNWFLSKTFVGDPTNVDFFLENVNNIAQIKYTNTNSVGAVTINFKTATLIKDTPEDEQINVNLPGNVTTFTNIPQLSYQNSIYDSLQVVVYVASEDNAKYGMYILNVVLKGNAWVLNSHSSGNISNLNFRILNIGSTGVIQYTNNNSSNLTLRIQQKKILKSDVNITLNDNTISPSEIDSKYLSFEKTQHIFQVLAFVEVPDLNLYAFYEIEGLYCDGMWKLNSHYIGDRTGITFSVDTLTYGVLKYTNTNNVDAYIKYIVESPLVIPLSVKKGGTGSSYLRPNAVLRGNGIDPIIGTQDFIYEDETLILGSTSAIKIENTTDVSSITSGGTFTTYGGAAIGKSLHVGGSVMVNNIDVTPSIGDLNQRQFMAANNQTSPANVIGFAFIDPVIKSFSGIVCVTIEALDDTFDSLYEVKGIRKKNGWIMNTSFIGDEIGVAFKITSSGQVQYTSKLTPNWISTTMKYRAMTTTL
uniref:Peptidase S74 domain-containing protein n=1 Tax=viral metagenome TaxID=1070528 RepID=A0A6C0E1A0_9ZZZZ